MSVRYRVFGASAVEPGPESLLRFLAGLGPDFEGHFHGDDQGWFRLRVLRQGAEMVIERYLSGEEGIRAELNSWAAWVEANGDGPEQGELMRRLVSAQQVIVLHDFPAEVAGPVCTYLAEVTDGVWQADGRGFFRADGTQVVADG